MRRSYMKKSLLLLCLAAVIVTGGCGKEKEKRTTEELTTERQRETTEKVTTEAATEKITEETTEEPDTEAPLNKQSMDIIELKAFSENYDGEDTISGHIKDIAYTEGFLIILSDDGHLYSYYTDSGYGYKIYDWGKPGWEMADIGKVSVTASGYDGESGEFFVIEGNRYYYVELQDGKIVYNIEGVLLEGQEIINIYLSGLGFEVYCADGSWYEVKPDKEHYENPPYRLHIDSEKFWSYQSAKEPEVILPEGQSLSDRAGNYYLLSDGKLYWGNFMDAPIEDTADYTFTKVYRIISLSPKCMGITDTNELLLMESANNNKDNTLDALYTIALPESEILDIWYTSAPYQKSVLIVKTADGYYSCVPEESTSLEPDESFNALTEEVIDIRSQYVLLNDGCVYELPSY